MIAKKTRSRRRTIVTPTNEAHATRKVSRKEIARIKANQGAKKQAARPSPKKDRENEEGNDDEGGLTEREKSRRRAAQWAQAAKVSPKKDPGIEENKDNRGGLTDREKSRRYAAEWAKDQKAKRAQDKKREATGAAAATPKKRPRSENK